MASENVESDLLASFECDSFPPIWNTMYRPRKVKGRLRRLFRRVRRR